MKLAICTVNYLHSNVIQVRSTKICCLVVWRIGARSKLLECSRASRYLEQPYPEYYMIAVMIKIQKKYWAISYSQQQNNDKSTVQRKSQSWAVPKQIAQKIWCELIATTNIISCLPTFPKGSAGPFLSHFYHT